MNDEEMGFLDVYGLSEDSAMDGMDAEQEDLGDGKVDELVDHHMDNMENNRQTERADELVDMKVDSKLTPILAKGKGKETLDTEMPLDHRHEAVNGSLGFTTYSSSYTTFPPLETESQPTAGEASIGMDHRDAERLD